MSFPTRGEKYALMSVVNGICLLAFMEVCPLNVDTSMMSRSWLGEVSDAWRAASYACVLSARTAVACMPTI